MVVRLTSLVTTIDSNYFLFASSHTVIYYLVSLIAHSISYPPDISLQALTISLQVSGREHPRIGVFGLQIVAYIRHFNPAIPEL